MHYPILFFKTNPDPSAFLAEIGETERLRRLILFFLFEGIDDENENCDKIRNHLEKIVESDEAVLRINQERNIGISPIAECE